MRSILIYRHQLFRRSEVFISRQAEALRSFMPVYTGAKTEGAVPENATVETLDGLPPWRRASYTLFFANKPLLEQVAKHAPVLVHAHFGVDAIYAMKLSAKLGVPLVTTFHGFDATISKRALTGSLKPAWIYYALLRKRLANSGDVFICVSDYIRKRVLELGFPEERTITHYMGINTNVVNDVSVERHSHIVLHVARLVEKKGTQYLIHAFSEVIKQMPNATLVILGEGPLRRNLEELSQSLRISNHVRFLGAQSNQKVLSWMRKAAVLVLPSVTAENGDMEGLPTVLLEAAASGVPVIATRHGGIPEAVIDSKTGFLIGERDVPSMARYMILLFKDEFLRRKMGNTAQEWVKNNFDLDRQTRKLEKIYEQIIENRLDFKVRK